MGEERGVCVEGRGGRIGKGMGRTGGEWWGNWGRGKGEHRCMKGEGDEWE